jgi:hypothetical protein
LVVAGCGHNPVSYSQPVDVTLPTITQKSVSGANVSVQKNINTVSGNPYGAFVNAAVQQLNGKNPSRIAVTSLTLTLLGTSSATGLQQDHGDGRSNRQRQRNFHDPGHDLRFPGALAVRLHVAFAGPVRLRADRARRERIRHLDVERRREDNFHIRRLRMKPWSLPAARSAKWHPDANSRLEAG